MEKAILAKLSLQGRDAILSQKNAVILGYLKALDMEASIVLNEKGCRGH